MEAERREKWNELLEDRLAAERLGVPRHTIMRSLREGGMPQREINLLMRGRYAPYKLPVPLKRKINRMR